MALLSTKPINPEQFGIDKKPLKVIPGYFTHLMLSKYLTSMDLSYKQFKCNDIAMQYIDKNPVDCIVLCPNLLSRTINCLPSYPGYIIDSACIIIIDTFAAHYISAVIENGYHYVIEPVSLIKIPIDWTNLVNMPKIAQCISVTHRCHMGDHASLSHVLYVHQKIIDKDCRHTSQIGGVSITRSFTKTKRVQLKNDKKSSK